MTCRVCHGERWVGWTSAGLPVRCQWCNMDDPPAWPKRDIRAERVALVKAIPEEATVGVNDSGATWERVIMLPDEANYLERTEVPGGWLYRTMVGNDSGNWVVAMVFVPRAATEYRSR